MREALQVRPKVIPGAELVRVDGHGRERVAPPPGLKPVLQHISYAQLALVGLAARLKEYGHRSEL